MALFTPQAIVSTLTATMGEVQNIAATIAAAAGAKPDIVQKVHDGIAGTVSAISDLSNVTSSNAAKPLLQRISDGFEAVDHNLAQLPLGAREAEIVQIAGIVVPMVLNAASVVFH